MGLFDKLLTALSRRSSLEPTATPQPSPKVAAPKARNVISSAARQQVETTVDEIGGLVFIATITGPATSTPEIPAEVVATRVADHAFVSAQELPQLKTGHEWWREDTHKRRRREGSEKSYAWVTPFLPLDIAKRPELQAAQEWGPHGAKGLSSDLRKLIREKRKASEPHKELLMALYGAAIAADVADSICFEGTRVHHMAQFVDIRDLDAINVEYSTLGYEGIKSLTKTDVKWLVEAFGEPSSHITVADQWPNIRRNAVNRYCWREFRQARETAKALGRSEPTMFDWLTELFQQSAEHHGAVSRTG